jgi:hypothetical protein
MIESMAGSSFYSDEEDPFLVLPTTITYHGVAYPLMAAHKFGQWMGNIVSNGAAFSMNELKTHYRLIKFCEADFSKYRRLSNLAHTPFHYQGHLMSSVESLIYANMIKETRPFSDMDQAIARMDGYSARNIGKYLKGEFLPYEMKLLVDYKFDAYPALRDLAFTALEQRNFLVCTDRTPYDERSIDLIWGMVEHNGYLIGRNLLGKIYHDLYTEDRVIRSLV